MGRRKVCALPSFLSFSFSLYFSGLDVDEERKPKMGAKKLLAETDQVVLVRREMESKRTG